MDELTLTFNSPLTEEDWDVLEDVDFDHTDRVWFHTKHGKDVEFVKVVRCGECIYWEDDWEPSMCNSDTNRHYCVINDLFPTGDWFCKEGHRREDGDRDD